MSFLVLQSHLLIPVQSKSQSKSQSKPRRSAGCGHDLSSRLPPAGEQAAEEACNLRTQRTRQHRNATQLACIIDHRARQAATEIARELRNQPPSEIANEPGPADLRQHAFERIADRQ